MQLTPGTDDTESVGGIPPGPTDVGTERSYEYYRVALADESLPCAFVDLDRIDANARALKERARDTPVRIATKSVRCRAVLDRVLDRDGFEGLLCYSGREAGYLADHGFDDLLVAYPVWQASEVEPVCGVLDGGGTVRLMVDSAEHVGRLSELGERFGTTIPVCLDIDLSTTQFGIHFGVRRSGIRDAEAALSVAEAVTDANNVELEGVMGYEAQLAGVTDDNPANSAVVNAVMWLLKRRSRPRVRERRTSVVRALERAGHEFDLVNGGGTGCVEFTVRDPSVTEVTVGSGLYAPALFDHYRSFQHLPAAGFAVAVTRTPDPGVYTCRGGGYVASGPPDEASLPEPWFPDVEFRDEEAAGEVQTPVLYDGPREIELGDPIFFRHAKAGELAEQFEQLHLVAGGEVTETVPTYRGDGRCFL
jgi:D-serine deaminase-like pyridoxal phosphate-dependent protein